VLALRLGFYSYRGSRLNTDLIPRNSEGEEVETAF
jgi:hypothetical protein